MFRRYARNYHSYLHLIPALGIVREAAPHPRPIGTSARAGFSIPIVIPFESMLWVLSEGLLLSTESYYFAFAKQPAGPGGCCVSENIRMLKQFTVCVIRMAVKLSSVRGEIQTTLKTTGVSRRRGGQPEGRLGCVFVDMFALAGSETLIGNPLSTFTLNVVRVLPTHHANLSPATQNGLF